MQKNYKKIFRAAFNILISFVILLEFHTNLSSEVIFEKVLRLKQNLN